MTATALVTTDSKPTLVTGLRAAWRRSAEHAAEQLARFVRLTILAAMPSVIDLLKGGKFDYITLLAFIAPFAEVAYRQVFPALGAAKADSAPGVTIVPSQVDPSAVDVPNAKYPSLAPEPDDGPDDAAPPAPIGDVEEDAGQVGHADLGAIALGVLIGVLIAWLLLH